MKKQGYQHEQGDKQTNKSYRDTKCDKRYLALLYLGSYDLSSLLYDINQQVTLFLQLVFLSRCIYLDKTGVQVTYSHFEITDIMQYLNPLFERLFNESHAIYFIHIYLFISRHK